MSGRTTPREPGNDHGTYSAGGSGKDPVGGSGGGSWRNAILSYANQGAIRLFTTVEDLGRWIRGLEKLFPVDRSRFGWGLNSVEFSFGEDGMSDGFRATGGRVRNLRFNRVEEWGGFANRFPVV